LLNTERPLALRARITCPHCWESFPTEDVLWVSEHPKLLGDSRLGSNEQCRFLPSRFDVRGNALDAMGATCEELACPNCHLSVPRSILELPPHFVSIVGSPSCGKTYFLASMTWQLRQILPQRFAVSFADADPKANRVLNEYEEQQFAAADADAMVKLAKTEEYGHLYSTVTFAGRETIYPMPFLFSLRPTPQHASRERAGQVSRLICMYDNAGESFLPGRDSSQNRVTRHLARSNALLYLYDPTQEPRFRRACSGHSADPQVVDGRVTSRQELVLHELIDRVRRLVGLPQNRKHNRPLFVVVTKSDVWRHLLDEPLSDTPLVCNRQKTRWALDMAQLTRVSMRLRELLWKFSPELVSAAEAFAQEVRYVPVSALGTSPELDARTGQLAIRPRNIQPAWVEVPMLWTLSQHCTGLIPFTTGRGQEGDSGANSPLGEPTSRRDRTAGDDA
jgi:hypothetical protein